MSINKNYIIAGMMATALVAPLSNNTESHASEIRVTTTRVHFRTGASTKHSSMGVLAKGTKVTYLETVGSWTKVQYNSKTGYIHSDYLVNGESTPSTPSTSQTRYVVTSAGSKLNVRKGPSTGYGVVTKLSRGTAVTVTSTSNGWSKISVNGTIGYVSSQYLSDVNPNGSTTPDVSVPDNNAPVTPDTPAVTQTKYVTANSGLNMRSGPSTNHSIIRKLSKGTAVTVTATNNGWSKITVGGTEGYVSNEYLSDTKPAEPQQPESNSSAVSSVVNLANKLIGKPYVYGAEGPNAFDCSGFTYYVYKNAAGITLPRTSAAQSKYGTTVSKSNLQPGDLIFFDTQGSNNGGVSHVGLYVGNGQMIHASSSSKQMKKVSINTSYWNTRYVTAKRVL